MPDPVIHMLKGTVVDTVRYYADNGDIVSAAHIALVFYVTITGDTAKNEINVMEEPLLPQNMKYKPILQRVLCSFLQTLQ